MRRNSYHIRRIGWLYLLLLLLTFAFSSTVSAQTIPAVVGQIKEYRIPFGSSPTFITRGPDGNFWFSQPKDAEIGRVGLGGNFTRFGVPRGNGIPYPEGITTGPDGNLWFTELGKVGKITTDGTITLYPVPSSYPYGITTGPDVALWFTEYKANQIGQITPGGQITEYPIPTSGGDPSFIVSGPHGKLWFTENNANQIGKISTK